MANSLLSPAAIIGLMGQGRNQNSLLPFFQQQADPLDELMAQRAPNGYVETPQGTYYPADQVAQPQQPMQAPQRERVSGWRVLDRVLGGQTITGGLDAERARLQSQADLPQRNARIQQVLGSIQDPREQALFLGLGGEDWQKNVGQQFAPQVIAPGAIQAIAGRAAVGAPQQYDQGDQRRSFDPLTRQDTLVNQRGPTIAEQTAQQRLAWDQQYGQGRLGVDQYQAQTGRINAEGYTLGDNQQRYQGSSLVAENAGAPKPPTAQQAEAQGALTTLSTEVVPTLQQMRQALQSGDVITGFGAEARLQAARALAATGNEEARRKVAATEAYRNSSGRLRVGMAKSLGANPSNADIALLEKVTAGDIGQNSDSLLSTIDQGLSFANSRAGSLASQAQPTQGTGGPVRVTSVAQARALPSGTVFIDPNGVQRVVP